MNQGSKPSNATITRAPRKIWIVLPAYNEEASMPPLLERIAEAMAEAILDYHVIVVDDGSTDETATVTERFRSLMPLEMIRHAQNKGLGATIRTGFMEAIKKAAGRDIIITMDADNSHAPELILRMVRLIREGHDVVIASRYQPGSRVFGVPWHRRLLSDAGSLFLRTLFPIAGVRDYTCGYRAYRADLLQSALASAGSDFFEQEGFQIMVDILLKLRTHGAIMGEVPMILRYDLKPGKSKMKVGQTLLNVLALSARRFIRR